MGRNLTKEEIEKIINCGALGYDHLRVSVITGIDSAEIKKQLKAKSGEIFKAYQRGEWINDYLIDVKLIEMAQGGDIKAVTELDSRKRYRIINSKK